MKKMKNKKRKKARITINKKVMFELMCFLDTVYAMEDEANDAMLSADAWEVQEKATEFGKIMAIRKRFQAALKEIKGEK